MIHKYEKQNWQLVDVKFNNYNSLPEVSPSHILADINIHEQKTTQLHQVVVNPAIGACEAGHRWQLALALFTGVDA